MSNGRSEEGGSLREINVQNLHDIHSGRGRPELVHGLDLASARNAMMGIFDSGRLEPNRK